MTALSKTYKRGSAIIMKQIETIRQKKVEEVEKIQESCFDSFNEKKKNEVTKKEEESIKQSQNSSFNENMENEKDEKENESQEEYEFEQEEINSLSKQRRSSDGQLMILGKIDKLKENIDIDDFQFLKFIGKGSYGGVWLVRKKQQHDLYAMKIIDTSKQFDKQLFCSLKAERDVFAIVNGDFVAKAYYSFIYKGYICFVLEYLSGGDFAQILDKFCALDEKIAKFYIAELILAIESLHKLNIIHRDIKPDNILLDENGHIKLADFGLSEIGVRRRMKSRTFTFKQDEELEFKKQQELFGQLCTNAEISQESSKEFQIADRFGSNFRKTINQKFFFCSKNSTKQQNNQRILGTPDYISPEIIKGESITNQTID